MPCGTSSFSGPLSSVVATCTSMPWRDRLRVKFRTISLGPPRSGPTEGITWRILVMGNGYQQYRRGGGAGVLSGGRGRGGGRAWAGVGGTGRGVAGRGVGRGGG